MQKHRITVDYLECTAAKFPDKIAIIDGEKSITFAELRRNARRMATAFIKKGITKSPVAVMLGQTAEAVVAFLGVLYSGNFYTVIDEKMPESRINKILATLNPSVVVTNAKNLKMFPNGEVYDSLINTKENDILLNETLNNILSMDVNYALFTSGSTGTPKGVTISQAGVIDYTDWVTKTFDVNKNTIIGNQAPFYFDNSVLDIYQMIATGATLNIIPRNLFIFPLRLMEYVRDNNINFVFWVPSVLCNAVNFDILNEVDISCLKKVLFAGEVMPNKQLNAWRKRLPNALFANLYGPTEITVDCTYYIVDREFADDEPLPIGKPCKNTKILVLNENNKPVKNDEIGEICVGGVGVSYGYYNAPEKTAEVFVQNPLNKSFPEIIYKTGDLAHYNEYGELMFDGRRDTQIKHMGHRIELGEIENAAINIDKIIGAACLYSKENDAIIICYEGELSDKDLRLELAKKLPTYMLPTVCHKIDKMPMNANGKIDRVALKNEFCGRSDI